MWSRADMKLGGAEVDPMDPLSPTLLNDLG